MSEVVIPLTLLVGWLAVMLGYAIVEDRRRNSGGPPDGS